MLLCENGAVGPVAIGTEFDDFFLQQELSLCGCVGEVAGDATIGYRFVLEFDLCSPVHKGFMAIRAELVPCLDKIELVAGGVGVMALHAVSFHSDLVRTAPILGEHRRVACKADGGGIRGQHLPVAGSMGVMAAGALPLFQRSVDICLFQVILKSSMTLEAQFAARPRLEFEFLAVVLCM
jgi:hypothetical protein